MERVFYVWLNDKPVKKFVVPKNGSMKTMYKNYVDYSIKKIKGKIWAVNGSEYLGGAYITNGIDKLVLKEEDGNEWLDRLNTEKMKRQIKRNEKIKFEDTEMYRQAMSQIC